MSATRMHSRTIKSARLAATAILTVAAAAGTITVTAGPAAADTPTGWGTAPVATPLPSTSVPVVPPAPVVVVPPPAEPAAIRISQSSGSSSWSRTVTIDGSGFTNLSAVLVGGAAQSGLTVVSDARATFTMGPNITFQAQSNVPISLVATYDGSTQATNLTFTYIVRTRVDREMQYAFQHWNDKASARFGYLAGRDCADFVSQLLLARGWKQTAEWFNDGPKAKTWSAAWWSSTAMSNWLHDHPNLATHLTYSQRAQAVVGDIVQFDWDGAKGVWEHTAVVSKVVVLPNGLHDIYYVAHTNNQQYGGSVMLLAADKKDFKHLRVQLWSLKR